MNNYYNLEKSLYRPIMIIFGTWPKERTIGTYIRYVIFLTVVLSFCNIPQSVRLFKVKDNFDDLLEVITNCNLVNILSLVKNVIFWSNHKALRKLLDIMARDWTAAKTEMEQKLMQKNAELCRLSIIIILSVFESAIFSFLLVNVYMRWKESHTFNKGNFNASDRIRPLYMPASFPWDVQKTPNYEITWFLQFLSTLFAGTANATMDCFFSSLVFHLCGQLQCLRWQFDSMLVQTSGDKDTRNKLNFSAIVERHKFLIRFAQTVEDLFNMQFLIQLLSSILIFCLIGYQIVKIITSEVVLLLNLIFAICYYVCFAVSLLVYCLIATVLSEESIKIRETAYNSEWHKLSPSDARLLILILIRTLRPLELTAGKFVGLSLELYCSIVKTSGGYLSVLLATKRRIGLN